MSLTNIGLRHYLIVSALLLSLYGGSIRFTVPTLSALALDVVFGKDWDPEDYRRAVAAAYLSWAFLYMAVPLAAVGRTIGKSVLGMQVVSADGSRLSGRQAALRTVVCRGRLALRNSPLHAGEPGVASPHPARRREWNGRPGFSPGRPFSDTVCVCDYGGQVSSPWHCGEHERVAAVYELM